MSPNSTIHHVTSAGEIEHVHESCVVSSIRRQTHSKLTLLACIVTFSTFFFTTESRANADQQRELSTIQFDTEIYPVLQTHCIRCHGEEQQAGDLRLDRREYAEKGGHTGQPVLGGGEANAILERLTSTDESIRMPKGEPPLPAEVIETFRIWVQQGTPWKDPPDSEQNSVISPEPFAFSLRHLKEWNPSQWSDERIQGLMAVRNRMLIPVSGFLLFLLLCEHARKKASSKTAESSFQENRFWNRLARVSNGFHFTIFTLLLLLASLIYYQHHAQRADQKILQLLVTLHQSKSSPTPVPATIRRPAHPPRLGGVYYRGNDERNPALFNNGFYRTAEIIVSLRDQSGKSLEWGDAVTSQDDLMIRVEILRSPGTTQALFKDELLAKSQLSFLSPGATLDDRSTQLTGFVKIEEGRWQCDIPLKSSFPLTAHNSSGMFYLYQLESEATVLPDTPHYVIGYSLKFEDNLISHQSEIWMNYVFKTSQVLTPSERQIPEDQWFSFRPIPEIEGPNSEDPELLGIE